MTSNKMSTNGGSPKTAGASDQFNIRWKNYTSVLHSTFRSLLEEERLVDVTLACEGGFIKCHRIILSACSSYFETLLNELGSDGNNGNNLIIVLKDLKLWELQALVQFMYNGEVSVKQNRLAPLVRAAESLHIRGLSTEPDEKSRGGRNDNGGDSSNSTPKIVRRPSLIKPENGQKSQVPQAQPVKRPSIPGGGVPAKIMKTVKRAPDNSPSQSVSRPNSASSSGSQFQRPKLISGRSNSGASAEDSATRSTQKIQSRSASNEEDPAEVGEFREEEDYADKYSDSADADQGEGDVGLVDESTYLDETENGYYEDGSEADTGPGFVGEHRSGGVLIMDPPITFPVIDAADRADRLKKATDLALSGVTVRQAASHYGIPRTTLCAYMKRRGYAGKRLSAGGGVQYHHTQEATGDPAENFNEENEFPFLGLADLLKDQPHYEMQENTC